MIYIYIYIEKEELNTTSKYKKKKNYSNDKDAVRVLLSVALDRFPRVRPSHLFRTHYIMLCMWCNNKIGNKNKELNKYNTRSVRERNGNKKARDARK